MRRSRGCAAPSRHVVHRHRTSHAIPIPLTDYGHVCRRQLAANNAIEWNHLEFEVVYASLESELRVRA